ncbi:MAG: M16 family metallopeptidase, partial [Bdellovibrionota bacterium]
TTWLDRTNYYESLPADQLELVMMLESDRMENLNIDDNLLKTEKDVVLGEYRMGLDDPYLQGSELLYATAFTKHPYRFSTIGTEQEIKDFTTEKANKFYGHFYAPGNATLLIVGDVDSARVSELASKYYGPYAATDIDRPLIAPEPAQTSERQAEYPHAQLQEPKLFVAYHTPAVTDADIPALWVLDSLLSSGRACVLEEIWVNSGLAVDVSASLDQFQDPGLFTITADIQDPHQPTELLGALDRALAGLASAALPAQVERAKNQLLLSVYHSYDENQSLASFIGEYIASAGNPIFAFDLVQRVSAVTADDVLRVVGKYLVPTNRTTVIGRPKP